MMPMTSPVAETLGPEALRAFFAVTSPDRDERLSASSLMTLQSERLERTFARAARTHLYRERLRGVACPSAERISELPLTTKEDLRALDADELVLSSRLAERSLRASGIGQGTVVYDASVGFASALERIGAAVVLAPDDEHDVDEHLAWMKDLRVEALLSTRSFAARLAKRAVETGTRIPSLAIGVLGGEAWSQTLRPCIEQGLGIHVFDTYGLPILGPSVAHECVAHRGLHLAEDNFLFEVLVPGKDRPVNDGEVGELVITALGLDTLPCIRYRTGDLVRLSDEPCTCGRTTRRIVATRGKSPSERRVGGVA